MHGRDEKCYNVLIRKPTGKRQLARLRYRWENANIKVDLREIRCDGVDWIHLAQDRDQCQAVVKMVMNLQVP
jgi:hypothetical protein